LFYFYRPKATIEDPSYSPRNTNNKNNVTNNHKTLYKANNGFKYILNVIDTFSKFEWVVPLKSKTSLEVSNAFSQIFKYNSLKKLHVNKGKELYNKDLKQLLNKFNITMYSTGTERKASFVERMNHIN